MTDSERIKQLEEVLIASYEHHEYCGWGDSYESSCARDSGLITKIEDTLPKEYIK